MKVVFAADHAGFELKGKLIEFVKGLGFEVEDCGASEMNAEDDYPDFIRKAAEKVSKDPENVRGIILGGSGQGEAIAANRFKNVRAVVFYGGVHEIVALAREHNDSNVLSLGARFVNEKEAEDAVKLWLITPFSNEVRHIRRIQKIDA